MKLPQEFRHFVAHICLFFFNDPATTEIYTLSLHDALPICIRVGALVVDLRRGHLYRAGAGQHLARLVIAVAHNQAVTVLVALVGERGDVGIDLGAQGFGQHPAGTVADDLVNQRRLAHGRLVVITSGGGREHGEHGRALPPGAPTSACLRPVTRSPGRFALHRPIRRSEALLSSPKKPITETHSPPPVAYSCQTDPTSPRSCTARL